MKGKLNKLLKMNRLISDLKSEAIRDRHWKTLNNRLKLRRSINDMTLGHIWDVDLIRHEKFIGEVLS